MDVPSISTSGLLILHEAVRRAVEADQNNPAKIDPYYGTKDDADWREWCRALERKLQEQGADFEPIYFE